MVAISIGWIPLIQEMQGGQLYIYIQSIAAYLSPPIAMIFCMAIVWPRMNEQVSADDTIVTQLGYIKIKTFICVLISIYHLHIYFRVRFGH